MPIPASQIRTCEITMMGVIGSGGSNSKNVASVFHYSRTTTVNTFSKTALHNAFVAGPVAAILAACNLRYSQTTTTVRNIDDAEDLATSFTQTGVGLVTGDGQPADNAVYLLMRTAIRGRSYRGSKHMAPLSESDSVDDILTGAGLTRWTAVATALAANLTDANGNVWNPTVFSRSLSQILANPTSVVYNAITSVAVNKRIGMMKRRKVRSVY